MYLWLKIKKACAIWFGADYPNKWLSAVVALSCCICHSSSVGAYSLWYIGIFGIYSTTINNNNSFLIRVLYRGVNGSWTLYERAVTITTSWTSSWNQGWCGSSPQKGSLSSSSRSSGLWSSDGWYSPRWWVGQTVVHSVHLGAGVYNWRGECGVCESWRVATEFGGYRGFRGSSSVVAFVEADSWDCVA